MGFLPNRQMQEDTFLKWLSQARWREQSKTWNSCGAYCKDQTKATDPFHRLAGTGLKRKVSKTKKGKLFFKGSRQRKTVAGNTIGQETSQVNMKISKKGSARIGPEEGNVDKKPAEKKEEAKEEKTEIKKEEKTEQPKAEKKPEVKKEVQPKQEKPAEVKKEPKESAEEKKTEKKGREKKE